MNISIIVKDKAINIDGKKLHVPDFEYPDASRKPYINVIRWNGESGKIEYVGKPNEVFSQDRYAELVQPYVDAFNNQKAKNEQADKDEQLSANAIDEAKNRRKKILGDTDWWDLKSIDSKPDHDRYRAWVRDVLKHKWDPHYVWDDVNKLAVFEWGVEFYHRPDDPEGIPVEFEE